MLSGEKITPNKKYDILSSLKGDKVIEEEDIFNLSLGEITCFSLCCYFTITGLN